jgi:hypothetical protein
MEERTIVSDEVIHPTIAEYSSQTHVEHLPRQTTLWVIKTHIPNLKE